MYVLEVVFGGTAEGTFAADTTYVIAASLCDWTVVDNSGSIVDSGFNATSAGFGLVVIGDATTVFVAGVVISPNADGSEPLTVASSSYDGDRTTIVIQNGEASDSFSILDDIYIVTTGSGGYRVDAAKLIMGFNSNSAGVANGAFDFTSTNTSSIRLGYVGKTGRFTAITN